MRTEKCEILVVGGGPAGGMAAKTCAANGLDTILIEKKAEVGAPLRCAEGVSKKMFKEINVEPRPEWIRADMKGAIIKSPDGTAFALDESKAGAEVGYVLERHLFDKGLVKLAGEAGARIMMRTWMYDVIRDGNGKIVGAKCKSMGEDLEIYCDCIVGCDGVESQVGRWAGMDTNLKLNDIEPCIQYRMCNLDCSMDFCEFVLGRDIAPGGYLWIFPKGDGVANVGIGISGQFCKDGIRPKYYLDKFIANDPRFKNAQIIEVDAGFDSTCPGLDNYSVDNVLLCGDSARLIDPLTGGGIGHACISGMYAGEVLAECKAKGDYSREALKAYDRRIRKRMENGLYRDWMAKERLASLDDDTMNQLMKLLTTANIEHVNVQNLLIAIKDKFPQVVEGFEDLI